MMWLYLVILPLCIWLVWDDFVNREIHVVAPLGLALAGAGLIYLKEGIEVQELFTNTFIVLTVLSLLVIYGSIRFGKPFIQSHFGLGDVLVIIALIPIFAPTVLLMLIVLGCLIGILGILVLPSFKKRGAPLAGIYGILIPLSILFKNIGVW